MKIHCDNNERFVNVSSLEKEKKNQSTQYSAIVMMCENEKILHSFFFSFVDDCFVWSSQEKWTEFFLAIRLSLK